MAPARRRPADQPAELGVALGRLLVARGRRGIPCFGREITGVGGRIAVERRVVSLTGGAEPFAGGVQPGPGGPRASQLAVVMSSADGAAGHQSRSLAA